MRSNYKRIGDFIHQVKVKNKDGAYDQLLGINIDKFFMPSVANVIGTDLTKYKVVEYNQFACNRMHVGRDYRIPIALSQSNDPFIVSPAYTVFEITDRSELYPEYLMMWFSRAEFDREAWFHTDADVRGGLPWDLFCDIKLPVPSIEKQREIVKEYNTIVNRIKLNEQLNQKLEETAQALYKHWFVDFEFPNKNGQPYKSSGGKMIYNEELDQEIPEDWKADVVDSVCKIIRGASPRPINDFMSSAGMPWVKISDATACMNKYLFSTKEFIIEEGVSKSRMVKPDTLILSNSASPGLPRIMKIDACVHDGWLIFSDYNGVSQEFMLLFLLANKREILSSSNGSVFKNLKTDILKDFPIAVPNKKIIEEFTKLILKLNQSQLKCSKIEIHLTELKNILLAKMSKVESLKTEQVL